MQVVQAVPHRLEGGERMTKKKKEREPIECTVEFTEGADKRITDAFVDLYYQIKGGIYKGPLLSDKKEDTA